MPQEEPQPGPALAEPPGVDTPRSLPLNEPRERLAAWYAPQVSVDTKELKKTIERENAARTKKKARDWRRRARNFGVRAWVAWCQEQKGAWLKDARDKMQQRAPRSEKGKLPNHGKWADPEDTCVDWKPEWQRDADWPRQQCPVPDVPDLVETPFTQLQQQYEKARTRVKRPYEGTLEEFAAERGSEQRAQAYNVLPPYSGGGGPHGYWLFSGDTPDGTWHADNSQNEYRLLREADFKKKL